MSKCNTCDEDSVYNAENGAVLIWKSLSKNAPEQELYNLENAPHLNVFTFMLRPNVQYCN